MFCLPDERGLKTAPFKGSFSECHNSLGREMHGGEEKALEYNDCCESGINNNLNKVNKLKNELMLVYTQHSAKCTIVLVLTHLQNEATNVYLL